ncbi:hypothetical protein C8F01DRAFT_1254696 [Mycena amicta]|nr:hypothetical protein C8F01DRAFT_1254696 [Mycena amicta]
MFTEDVRYDSYFEERRSREDAIREYAANQGIRPIAMEDSNWPAPSTNDSSSMVDAYNDPSSYEVTFVEDTPSIQTASLHTPYPPTFSTASTRPRNINMGSSSYSIHHFLLPGGGRRAVITPVHAPPTDVTGSLVRPTAWSQLRHPELRQAPARFIDCNPLFKEKEVLQIQCHKASLHSPLIFVVTSIPRCSLLLGDHIWFTDAMDGEWIVTSVIQRDYIWCEVEFYSPQVDAFLTAWVLPFYFNRDQPQWRYFMLELAKEFGQEVGKRFQNVAKKISTVLCG